MLARGPTIQSRLQQLDLEQVARLEKILNDHLCEAE